MEDDEELVASDSATIEDDSFNFVCFYINRNLKIFVADHARFLKRIAERQLAQKSLNMAHLQID